MVEPVLRQAPDASVPPAQLADASKITGMLKFTGVGVNLNFAVGVSACGRITPGGTRLMLTVDRTPVLSLPMGTAPIDTTDPLPPCSAGGAGGAVYTARAFPSL